MIARDWKAYYAADRAQHGPHGLRALFDRAPLVALPPRGALVFPHTRLASSGHLTAAVARAIARSGACEVLALGVLHGARARDADAVAAARAGDPEALALLRRVHGPGAPHDAGHADEEFSLDGLAALLPIACELESRSPVHLVARYPFLVGAEPALSGLDELRAILARGAVLVATADPVHHGPGYGTPSDANRDPLDPATHEWARDRIAHALSLLAAGDLPGFLATCHADRSDFRDPGATLSALLGGRWCARILELDLADYASATGAAPPTWVAGALTQIEPVS